MISTTTLNQIESHRWEAANILRGPVDAADFKTYVFPLLFFKWISDVHDEDTQQSWRNRTAMRQPYDVDGTESPDRPRRR